MALKNTFIPKYIPFPYFYIISFPIARKHSYADKALLSDIYRDICS